MNAVFARATGRMMKIIEQLPDGRVHVSPNPRCPEYRRLQPYEKHRDAIWPSEWVYTPRTSQPLDLLERLEWSRFYPSNLKYAV